MGTEEAYRALSEGTRRRILDLLRDHGPLRASDVAKLFPRISRPAVSKHLRVLRRARLVRQIRAGRERWYALDVKPLRDIYEGWLRGYEVFWTERMPALKEAVESEERRRRNAQEG